MIDGETFRRLRGRFASGIAIITARDGDRDVGMTVSAFCSVSLEPSYVLVSIGHDASMHGLMMGAEHIGINVLSNEQEALSRRFADPESGIEVLATKGGAGSLALDGQPLALKDAKPLPSSD